MSDDRWRSPLGSRYASPAMQTLWGERHRIGLWRRLWLALAEAERELGLDIPEQAIAQMRAHLDDADLDLAARYERRFRHDVMAHIHAFGDQAPAARPYLHLGATRRPAPLARATHRRPRRAGGFRYPVRRPAVPGIHPLSAGPTHHGR